MRFFAVQVGKDILRRAELTSFNFLVAKGKYFEQGHDFSLFFIALDVNHDQLRFAILGNK